MGKAAIRLWTSQPTKRSIAHRPPCRISGGKDVVRGSGTGSWSLRPRRSRSVLRGESTTTYASSKLNRVGRRAARYDSGLEAHKCNRPAHKRPAPPRIAHEQIACSRSRCGNSSTLHLAPVNSHSQTLSRQPTLQHNHARYDALNRLATVQENNTGTTAYGYDNVGNLQSATYPNGVVHRYSYDTRNRLTTLGEANAAQPVAG